MALGTITWMPIQTCQYVVVSSTPGPLPRLCGGTSTTCWIFPDGRKHYLCAEHHATMQAEIGATEAVAIAARPRVPRVRQRNGEDRPTTARCAHPNCGAVFPVPPRGRVPLYCSRACWVTRTIE